MQDGSKKGKKIVSLRRGIEPRPPASCSEEWQAEILTTILSKISNQWLGRDVIDEWETLFWQYILIINIRSFPSFTRPHLSPFTSYQPVSRRSCRLRLKVLGRRWRTLELFRFLVDSSADRSDPRCERTSRCGTQERYRRWLLPSRTTACSISCLQHSGICRKVKRKKSDCVQ